MKNYYIAITIKENEKYLSYVIKASESDNLVSKLKIKNIVNANVFSTKKRAFELAKLWNEAYKQNNLNMY